MLEIRRCRLRLLLELELDRRGTIDAGAAAVHFSPWLSDLVDIFEV